MSFSSSSLLISSHVISSHLISIGGGRRFVVLTTAGPDRVGIVHSLSSHLRGLHANIEESRMTVLGKCEERITIGLHV